MNYIEDETLKLYIETLIKGITLTSSTSLLDTSLNRDSLQLSSRLFMLTINDLYIRCSMNQIY